MGADGAQISRVQGEFAFQDKQEVFDRIRVDIDINTSQNKKDARYTPDDMQEFSNIAQELSMELRAQIESNLA